MYLNLLFATPLTLVLIGATNSKAHAEIGLRQPEGSMAADDVKLKEHISSCKHY